MALTKANTIKLTAFVCMHNKGNLNQHKKTEICFNSVYS